MDTNRARSNSPSAALFRHQPPFLQHHRSGKLVVGGENEDAPQKLQQLSCSSPPQSPASSSHHHQHQHYELPTILQQNGSPTISSTTSTTTASTAIPRNGALSSAYPNIIIPPSLLHHFPSSASQFDENFTLSNGNVNLLSIGETAKNIDSLDNTLHLQTTRLEATPLPNCHNRFAVVAARDASDSAKARATLPAAAAATRATSSFDDEDAEQNGDRLKSADTTHNGSATTTSSGSSSPKDFDDSAFQKNRRKQSYPTRCDDDAEKSAGNTTENSAQYTNNGIAPVLLERLGNVARAAFAGLPQFAADIPSSSSALSSLIESLSASSSRNDISADSLSQSSAAAKYTEHASNKFCHICKKAVSTSTYLRTHLAVRHGVGKVPDNYNTKKALLREQQSSQAPESLQHQSNASSSEHSEQSSQDEPDSFSSDASSPLQSQQPTTSLTTAPSVGTQVVLSSTTPPPRTASVSNDIEERRRFNQRVRQQRRRAKKATTAAAAAGGAATTSSLLNSSTETYAVQIAKNAATKAEKAENLRLDASASLKSPVDDKSLLSAAAIVPNSQQQLQNLLRQQQNNSLQQQQQQNSPVQLLISPLLTTLLNMNPNLLSQLLQQQQQKAKQQLQLSNEELIKNSFSNEIAPPPAIPATIQQLLPNLTTQQTLQQNLALPTNREAMLSRLQALVAANGIQQSAASTMSSLIPSSAVNLPSLFSSSCGNFNLPLNTILERFRNTQPIVSNENILLPAPPPFSVALTAALSSSSSSAFTSTAPKLTVADATATFATHNLNNNIQPVLPALPISAADQLAMPLPPHILSQLHAVALAQLHNQQQHFALQQHLQNGQQLPMFLPPHPLARFPWPHGGGTGGGPMPPEVQQQLAPFLLPHLLGPPGVSSAFSSGTPLQSPTSIPNHLLPPFALQPPHQSLPVTYTTSGGLPVGQPHLADVQKFLAQQNLSQQLQPMMAGSSQVVGVGPSMMRMPGLGSAEQAGTLSSANINNQSMIEQRFSQQSPLLLRAASRPHQLFRCGECDFDLPSKELLDLHKLKEHKITPTKSIARNESGSRTIGGIESVMSQAAGSAKTTASSPYSDDAATAEDRASGVASNHPYGGSSSSRKRNRGHSKRSGEQLPKKGVNPFKVDVEAFCEICRMEVCSKYFLKMHKQNVHHIPQEVQNSQEMRNARDRVLAEMRQEELQRAQAEHVQRVAEKFGAALDVTNPVQMATLAAAMPQLPYRSYTAKNHCDRCNKEVCNKYFLVTHMRKMHNVILEDEPGRRLRRHGPKSKRPKTDAHEPAGCDVQSRSMIAGNNNTGDAMYRSSVASRSESMFTAREIQATGTGTNSSVGNDNDEDEDDYYDDDDDDIDEEANMMENNNTSNNISRSVVVDSDLKVKLEPFPRIEAASCLDGPTTSCTINGLDPVQSSAANANENVPPEIVNFPNEPLTVQNYSVEPNSTSSLQENVNVYSEPTAASSVAADEMVLLQDAQMHASLHRNINFDTSFLQQPASASELGIKSENEEVEQVHENDHGRNEPMPTHNFEQRSMKNTVEQCASEVPVVREQKVEHSPSSSGTTDASSHFDRATAGTQNFLVSIPSTGDTETMQVGEWVHANDKNGGQELLSNLLPALRALPSSDYGDPPLSQIIVKLPVRANFTHSMMGSVLLEPCSSVQHGSNGC